MSPSEALCGDVNEGLSSLHGAPSGGWRYTGLGRAVKLSSTVVLPPSTAGSAHIRGPKEAKGGGTNPSTAYTPSEGNPPPSISFVSFLSVILGTILGDSLHTPNLNLGKLGLSPSCVALFLAFFHPHFTKSVIKGGGLCPVHMFIIKPLGVISPRLLSGAVETIQTRSELWDHSSDSSL